MSSMSGFSETPPIRIARHFIANRYLGFATLTLRPGSSSEG